MGAGDLRGRKGVLMSVFWQVLGFSICIPYMIEASVTLAEYRGSMVFAALLVNFTVSLASILCLLLQMGWIDLIAILCCVFGIAFTAMVLPAAMLIPQRMLCCCSSYTCFVTSNDAEAMSADEDYCDMSVGSSTCFADNWKVWGFWAGVVLSFIAIVLLCNALSLHRKLLYTRARINLSLLKQNSSSAVANADGGGGNNGAAARGGAAVAAGAAVSKSKRASSRRVLEDDTPTVTPSEMSSTGRLSTARYDNDNLDHYDQYSNRDLSGGGWGGSSVRRDLGRVGSAKYQDELELQELGVGAGGDVFSFSHHVVQASAPSSGAVMGHPVAYAKAAP